MHGFESKFFTVAGGVTFGAGAALRLLAMHVHFVLLKLPKEASYELRFTGEPRSNFLIKARENPLSRAHFLIPILLSRSSLLRVQQLSSLFRIRYS
jgi:hypothetical protein